MATRSPKSKTSPPPKQSAQDQAAAVQDTIRELASNWLETHEKTVQNFKARIAEGDATISYTARWHLLPTLVAEACLGRHQDLMKILAGREPPPDYMKEAGVEQELTIEVESRIKNTEKRLVDPGRTWLNFSTCPVTNLDEQAKTQADRLVLEPLRMIAQCLYRLRFLASKTPTEAVDLWSPHRTFL